MEVTASDVANPPSSFVRLSEQFRSAMLSRVSTLPNSFTIQNWIGNMTMKQMVSCFPDLQVAMGELKPRVEAAVQAAKQTQKDAKLPINILGTAYAAYVDLKRCYDARQGYATIYLSTPEMQQARDAVRQIEQAVKPKLDPNTTTDYVWSRVEQAEGRNFQPSGDYQEGMRMLCRDRLALLLGILREQVPESGRIEKDF